VGDGQTYERQAAERWFAAGNATSPLSGAHLVPGLGTSLVGNVAVKRAVDELLLRHPHLARFQYSGNEEGNASTVSSQQPPPQPGTFEAPPAGPPTVILGTLNSGIFLTNGPTWGPCASWRGNIHNKSTFKPAFLSASASGEVVLGGEPMSKSIQVWGQTSNMQLLMPDWALCGAVAPDGSWVAASGRGMTLHIWKLQRSQAAPGTETVLEGHTDFVRCMACCDNTGTRIVSGGDDWQVRIWDLGNQRFVTLEETTSPVTVCAATQNNDGSTVLVGTSEGSLHVYDRRASTHIATIPEAHESSGIVSGVLDPDGEWAVSTDTSGNVRVWESRAGWKKELSRLVLSGQQQCIAIGLPSKPSSIATADSTGELRVWRPLSGDVIAVCPTVPGPVVALASFVSPSAEASGKKLVETAETAPKKSKGFFKRMFV